MSVPEIRRYTITKVAPERAFEAWTEPEHLSRWFCDKVVGWPGYGGTLTMTWEKFGFSIDYYLPTIIPPKKVVMKSLIPGLGTQTLNISIRSYGNGCRVEIVETGPGAEGQAGAGDAKSGWEMSLALFKTYVENFWNKNRRTFFAIITAPYENSRLMHYYKDEDGLSKWLAKSGSIGDPGTPVSLKLKNGMNLTGKVMAVTSHELLVTWREITGFIEFKSFTGSAERTAILVRGSTYGDTISDEKLAEINRFMEQAVSVLHIILKAEEEARQTIAARKAAKEAERQSKMQAEAQAAALAAAQEILQAGNSEDELLRMTREAEEQAAKIKEELIQSADSFEESELPPPPLEPEDEEPDPVPNPGEELDDQDD